MLQKKFLNFFNFLFAVASSTDELVTPLVMKVFQLESRQSARTLNRRTHEEAQGNREECS